jgi:hypothetical protein
VPQLPPLALTLLWPTGNLPCAIRICLRARGQMPGLECIGPKDSCAPDCRGSDCLTDLLTPCLMLLTHMTPPKLLPRRLVVRSSGTRLRAGRILPTPQMVGKILTCAPLAAGPAGGSKSPSRSNCTCCC